MADILNHCTDGEKSVRAALKLLRKYGYAKLIRNNLSSGRIEGTEWAIFEIPQTELPVSSDSPSCRFKETRKNGTLSNTKKSTKIEASKKPSFAEIELFKAEAQDPTVRASIIGEIKGMMVSLLKIPEGSPYWNQWMERAEQCPLRVEWAFSMVDEDRAEIEALKKYGIDASSKLRNPSGKANWYFLNMDLKTGRVQNDR